jgi:hypothetical protein
MAVMLTGPTVARIGQPSEIESAAGEGEIRILNSVGVEPEGATITSQICVGHHTAAERVGERICTEFTMRVQQRCPLSYSRGWGTG